MYVGESATGDKAVDEELEGPFAEENNLTLRQQETEESKGVLRHTLIVRNADPFPVRFAIDFPLNSGRALSDFCDRLTAKPGKKVWAMTVPGNGTLRLRFQSAEREG